MQDYRVQLETYHGPMDLLLYLIRRDEVDIYDIPIARVLEQFMEYVRVLEVLDPDLVGEFLVMAATLMEIKSRLLLPKPPPEESDEDELDPRADLVRRLLAYKSFRDAARHLGDRAELRAQQFARPGLELPPDDEEENKEVDLEDAQIWDLLAAFNKLLSSVGQRGTTHDVTYDDTPVTLHAADILDRLEREGPVMAFEQIFEGRTLGEMIGLFLALLELIRQRRIRIEQTEVFGQIRLHLIDSTPITEVSTAFPDAGADTDEDPSAEPEPEPEPDDEADTSPTMYDDDDDLADEDDDEYSRAINAVEIADVDLGRSSWEDDPPAETEPETDEPEGNES